METFVVFSWRLSQKFPTIMDEFVFVSKCSSTRRVVETVHAHFSLEFFLYSSKLLPLQATNRKQEQKCYPAPLFSKSYATLSEKAYYIIYLKVFKNRGLSRLAPTQIFFLVNSSKKAFLVEHSFDRTFSSFRDVSLGFIELMLGKVMENLLSFFPSLWFRMLLCLPSMLQKVMCDQFKFVTNIQNHQPFKCHKRTIRRELSITRSLP